MRGRWFIAALVMLILGAVPSLEAIWGQQGLAGTNGTDAKPTPAKVGSYSLVITTVEPTATTHWLNPPPTIDVKGGTKLAPAESTGNLTVPQQYTIEAFGIPQQECEEAAQQQHGCDALDRTDLTIRDPHTVEYRIASHGGAVQLRVNLQVHDLLPVSHGGASTDWHAGDVIFVSVPKATPVCRFVSETLVGEWNGEPIVFEAGKALPASAKKSLEDLGVHQDLGDAVLYSYRVK
ncbi:MAG: hypothetical protein WCF17_15740 [Terracidiphilus sp.]